MYEGLPRKILMVGSIGCTHSLRMCLDGPATVWSCGCTWQYVHPHSNLQPPLRLSYLHRFAILRTPFAIASWSRSWASLTTSGSGTMSALKHLQSLFSQPSRVRRVMTGNSPAMMGHSALCCHNWCASIALSHAVTSSTGCSASVRRLFDLGTAFGASGSILCESPCIFAVVSERGGPNRLSVNAPHPSPPCGSFKGIDSRRVCHLLHGCCGLRVEQCNSGQGRGGVGQPDHPAQESLNSKQLP